MRTDTLSIPFWSAEEVESALRPALEHIEARRVLAYPTETIYGFGGGIDRDSVDALIALKTRPPAKPFLLLIAGADMIDKLDLHLPSYASNLVARHWPGPLTLVLAGGERRVPDRLRGPEAVWRCAGQPSRHDSTPSTRTATRSPPPARIGRGSAATSAAEILSQWGTQSPAASCACSTAEP
jgi:L-threonylcarbamoyladenylate synthase